jgi:hypothetical protein
MKWVTGRDLILMAALLFAALLLLFLRGGEEGSRYEILSGGKVIASGLLDEDREFDIFSVKNGKIAIVIPGCRDHTCIRTGYIGTPGQITACLPRGMVVRITGDGGVDAVV